jgi:hypothetical protein
VTPRYAADEIDHFAFLRSLWFDHDVSFDNDAATSRIRVWPGGFPRDVPELSTVTGRRLNFTTIGCAILWSPFCRGRRRDRPRDEPPGLGVAVDGYSGPYIAAVCYGSAVYGFLALLLSLRVVRQLGLLGRAGPGLLAGGRFPAVVVWFGTPLLFLRCRPAFAHAISAFVVAAFVTTWLSVRGRWPVAGVASLGALAALMAMVRERTSSLPGRHWISSGRVDRRSARRPAAAHSTAGGSPRGRWRRQGVRARFVRRLFHTCS